MKQFKKVLSIFVLCTSMLFFSKNGQAQCSGFNVTAVQTADGSSLGDATATASVTGGTFTTYQWYNSSSYIGWGAVKNSLTAGSYCVYAYDSSSSGVSCIDSFCFTVTDTGTFNCASINTYTYNYDSCQYNDAWISAYVYGGSGNYSYTWSNGTTTSSIGGLSNGIYTLTIVDNTFGCTITKTDTVVDDTCNFCANFNNNGFISENDLCFQNDITLIAQKWGGSYNYSYLWNTGATTQTISNKTAGSYSCTITDNVYGCKDTLYITVADDTCNPCNSFQANIYEMADPCGLNDIILSAYPQDSVGSSNYTYLWNTGSTVKTLLNKSAGSYWVRVTNNLTGCIDTAYLTVIDDTCFNCASFQASIVETDGCGLNDILLGSALTGGGSNNYNFSWSTGSTFGVIANKSNGSYSLVITDVIFGCIDTAYITVVDDTCAGSPCDSFNANLTRTADGANLNDVVLTVNVVGNSSNAYNTIWSNGESGVDNINVGVGTYCVDVFESSYPFCGKTVCHSNTIDTISPCQNFNTSIYENDSCQKNDITLKAYPQDSLGSTNYTYLWNTGATTKDINSKTTGFYWVIVTNTVTGCSDSAYIYVSDDTCNPCTNFQADAYKISDPCGLNNIIIGAFPFDSVNTSHYTYLWNTGANTRNLSNRTSGTYWVSVTDNFTGCSDSFTFIVLDSSCNPCSNFYSYMYNTDSCSTNDLRIFVEYGGGSNNISILWNTGSTSSYIENKPTGLYTVTVTDNILGCVRVDSIYAIDSNSKCCKANFFYSNNGAIVNFNSIQVGGTHSWTFGNGTNASGADVTNTYTSSGIYTVCHIINTTGCADTFCTTINAPNPGRNLKITHYGNCYVKDTNRYLYINYQNIGTTTENGIVEYKYPAGMTLVYSNITPTSNVNNILSFNVGSLAPGSSGTIFLTLHTPISFVLGSIKCDTAIILPITGDIEASNNTSYDCDSVKYSNDPNDKLANPSGIGEAGNIDPATKEINYLINFQNEGNYRTFRVRVEDEIDPALDINSLMIGDVSHTYRMVKTGRKIVWYFDNIELTPKSQNEKLSKGYVQYTLKLNSNLPLGTQIKNTAYIYFDANPAIITNTTKNTLKNADGNAAVSDRNQANLDFDANKLDERVVITSAEKMDAVRIYDLNGKLIVNVTPKSMKAEIKTELMSKQIYIIQVDMKESTVAKKFEF